MTDTICNQFWPRIPVSDRSNPSLGPAIASACADTGFFLVADHGLAPMINELLTLAGDFFAQPQGDRERVARDGIYGYVPQRSRAINPDRSVAEHTDYLEFGLGVDGPAPMIPGFAEAVHRYQSAALDLARWLLRHVATGLNADAAFFEPSMRVPECRLRMLHYPEIEHPTDGSVRIPTPAHTDYGLITLLATDGVPGLQVLTDDVWVPVNPEPGDLVVNLGDMLARWSNDRFVSTPHRVVGAQAERISLPFFVNPNPHAVLDSTDLSGSTGRYAPVAAGEYLRSRISGTTEPYV